LRYPRKWSENWPYGVILKNIETLERPFGEAFQSQYSLKRPVFIRLFFRKNVYLPGSLNRCLNLQQPTIRDSKVDASSPLSTFPQQHHRLDVAESPNFYYRRGTDTHRY
jgi:hypothetical protein